MDVAHLFEALNDGVLLIKLVNILKPGTIKNFNKIDPANPRATALAATGNIRLYLGAVQALGVPGVDLFLVEDLRTGRSMSMVCRNLASLCRIAARDLGWTGPVLGPRLATPGPKTWADVEYQPFRSAEEIPQSDLEEQLLMYKGLLEKETEERIKVMSQEAAMKHEVEKLRKQIKQYKRDHDDMMEKMGGGGAAAMMKPIAAFSEPGLPEHLQAVEKSEKEELEAKAARRARKLASEHHTTKQSSDALAEWQRKADKVKRKNEIKQQRRLSFSETVESPAGSVIEDFEEGEVRVDLLGDGGGSGGSRRRRKSPSGAAGDDVASGTPSKTRRDGSATGGRRALLVICIAEAVVILGLAGSFAWYALGR